MRVFTVGNQYAEKGIAFRESPYPCIEIGEEGRGRTLTRVAVARSFFEALKAEKKKTLERTSVLKLQDQTLILAEERNPDDRRALALVQISAGFRGSTKWTAANDDMAVCQNSERHRNGYGNCSSCGVTWPEGQDHPAGKTLHMWGTFPSPGVKVIAEGYCAQGDAGYAGGHAEKLLIMEPCSAFRIVRLGRLYGVPSRRYVRWTGEVMEVGSWDELFPPSERAAEEAEEV